MSVFLYFPSLLTHSQIYAHTHAHAHTHTHTKRERERKRERNRGGGGERERGSIIMYDNISKSSTIFI